MALKMANMRSSLGFAGASLLGIGPKDNELNSFPHTKPASYIVNQT
jgi:hypothetical protein